MNNEKIIFLDIDGCVNNLKNVIDNPKINLRDYNDWNKESLFLLNILCEKSNAKIVISSSWRKIIKNVDEWNEIFKNLNLYHINVIGLTPSSQNGFRGREINEWLEENKNTKSYIVIDDDSDFFPNQFRIKIDPYIGITYDDVEKAIKILEGQSLGLNLRCMEERNPPND